MSGHTLWSGLLQFGMVSVPVKLVSMQNNNDVTFRMLHSDCGNPIHYKCACRACDQLIGDRSEVARGYEYTKGKFVTVTDHELEQLAPQPSRVIEVRQFVPVSTVPLYYFDKTYALVPDQNADKGYTLLRRALRESASYGMVQFTARSKEYAGALQGTEHALLLHVLRFADAVAPPEQLVHVNDVKITKKEMNVARALIESMSQPAPVLLKDEQGARTRALLQNKINGAEPKTKKQRKHSPPADIMAQMQATLRSVGKERRGKKS